MSENENENKNSNASCGCGGCVSFILFILLITSLGWGLSIGKHKWNIDIFPPRIWDMNEKVETSETTIEVETEENKQK